MFDFKFLTVLQFLNKVGYEIGIFKKMEKALVEEEVRVRAGEDFLKKRLDGLTVNFDEDFSVMDTAEGAFTKPNAKQKAFYIDTHTPTAR